LQLPYTALYCTADCAELKPVFHAEVLRSPHARRLLEHAIDWHVLTSQKKIVPRRRLPTHAQTRAHACARLPRRSLRFPPVAERFPFAFCPPAHADSVGSPFRPNFVAR
jgi:hypothetical protein